MLAGLSTTLRSLARRWRHDERGASLIEYALLVALIAIACFGALAYFGNGSGNSLDNSRSCMEAAYDGLPPPPGCD